ncbi:MotA/TolQ/ExbB proton channel family protein [Persicirhabdus sediminis]|uniref:MotA/TolQ/ExbB proton channel family protein n=1 Tax=Persicirhabdus sediminis TaxID=454144 RepID=A0A8J7MGT1_9BACT|nr:MotA/TolQ/ExbB proton channel family protein [Persicirhabdus sediminis]MBK1792533.1 MotA/TolQ/ExbB proton channel family protein [Persicirhabdus sediminis]
MKSAFFTIGFSLLGMLSASAAETQEQQKDLLEILQMGGFVMYVLAMLSVVAVILIFFYILTIRRNAVVSNNFMNAAEALIRKRDYLGLVAHCNRENQSVARVTEKTLDFMTKNPGASFNDVREVAEAEGGRQAGMLTQRISYLMDVGTIAPMVGLLGTVIGMIQSFMRISEGQVAGVQHMGLAEGVYQALVTTAAGLVIGITATIFYSLFRGQVQKYIAELEAAATHLLALLSAQYNRRGGAAPRPLYASNKDHEDDFPEGELPVNDRPELHL